MCVSRVRRWCTEAGEQGWQQAALQAHAHGRRRHAFRHRPRIWCAPCLCVMHADEHPDFWFVCKQEDEKLAFCHTVYQLLYISSCRLSCTRLKSYLLLLLLCSFQELIASKQVVQPHSRPCRGMASRMRRCTLQSRFLQWRAMLLRQASRPTAAWPRVIFLAAEVTATCSYSADTKLLMLPQVVFVPVHIQLACLSG